MAIFLLTVTTPAQHKPATRTEDVQERAMLQSILLTAVSMVSNRGCYEGEINHGGATAQFGYDANG